MWSLWLAAEEALVASLRWPAWALRTVATLCCALLVLSLPQMLGTKTQETNTRGLSKQKLKEFRAFQTQYLTVFLIIMLADWLQGTNMYTLYSSYQMNIGTLFLTGFLSSAIFGTFLGIFVDRWGRRFGCIVYCILEIVINILEHVPDMGTLMVGRVLGGISTSLLFSAFEAWMVSEHRKKGFPEELLGSTFSMASWGNGVMAICAGFLAQISSDARGDIGPFQVAIVLTMICLGLIYFWEENTGDHSETETSASSVSTPSATVGETVTFRRSVEMSLNVISNNPAIMLLGLSQSFFEGAIFSFVFMWVPSLIHASKDSIPTGLIFSCFMLSMTIGGVVFSLILSKFPLVTEGLCVFIYFIAAATMLVPVYTFEFWPVFLSFLVLEAMLGMFNSCGAQLRSQYYPDNLQSSIMSVFRLPLNLLVVVGTKLSENANDVPSLQRVFSIVAGMHAIAFLLHLAIWLNIFKKQIPEVQVTSTTDKKKQ